MSGRVSVQPALCNEQDLAYITFHSWMRLVWEMFRWAFRWRTNSIINYNNKRHCQCRSPKSLSLSANKRSWQFLSASVSTARVASLPDRLAHSNRACRICSRTSVRYCSAKCSISASVIPSIRTRCRHFLKLTFSAMNLNSRMSAAKKYFNAFDNNQHHSNIQKIYIIYITMLCTVQQILTSYTS